MEPKISVCIIAKNEEKMLGDCLDSVRPIAYEIIVVDTGSIDDTVKLALSKGAKVVRSQWQNDFSFSRNLSLKEATGDFILVIDADERLQNSETLLDTVRSAEPNDGGWLVELLSTVDVRSSITQSHISYVLRLFRNNPNFYFEGVIHEQVLYSILKQNYKIKNCSVQLLHLGYDLDPEKIRLKQLRNLELLNIALEKDPNNPYNLTQRAHTYVALGRKEDAHQDYLRALELVPKTNKLRIRILGNGAMNAYKMGNKELSFRWALESYETVPNQSLANFILAELYFEKQHYHQALAHYLKMREVHEQREKDFFAILAGDYFIPLDHLAYKIGRCYFLMNDYKNASEEYELAYKLNPKNELGLIGLANIAFVLGKYDQSKQLLEFALKLNPSQTAIYDFLNRVENAINSQNQTQIPNSQTILQSNDREKHTQSAAPTLFENVQSVPKQATLSVCMIVKNEEDMLAACLDSVKNVADEIIITDTGSTDRTIEIAKNYGAKVFQMEWKDDFSAARNNSLMNCSCDWVLYIDADERLTPESQKNIKRYISQALPDVGALICTIESDHNYLDGNSEVHRGGYPRLFRNLGYPKVKFVGRVHEQISPSLVEAGYTFAISDLKIMHLGYNVSRKEMEEKVRRNYRMLIAHVQEEPLNGYAWFQLGQTLSQMHLFKEAEEAIRFAIKCGDLSNTIYSSAAAALSQLSGRRGDFNEALLWADATLAKSPNQIYGITLKAFALLNLNRVAEAIPYFETALQMLNQSEKYFTFGSPAFDIDISEDVLLKGLASAKQKLTLNQ